MEQNAQQFLSVFLPLFSLLFASVLVWLWLVFRLYRILEREHPHKYEEMGKPTLFPNDSFESGWVLLRFLVRKEYRALGDPELTKRGDFMFWFLIACCVLFAVMVISVFAMTAQVKAHVAP